MDVYDAIDLRSIMKAELPSSSSSSSSSPSSTRRRSGARHDGQDVDRARRRCARPRPRPRRDGSNEAGDPDVRVEGEDDAGRYETAGVDHHVQGKDDDDDPVRGCRDVSEV